ncbi:hypothetical protein KAJ27_08140 [bacterium]|nr:hypothetical protein [bacterium]
MSGKNSVSPVFIIIILAVVAGIIGYLYNSENKFIEGSKILKAKVLKVKYHNRTRRMTLQVLKGKHKGKNIEVKFPTMGSIPVGTRVDVRYKSDNLSEAVIDSFYHLHQTSTAILIASALLSIGMFIGLVMRR